MIDWFWFLQVLKALHAPMTVTLVQFAVGSVLITFMWALNLYKRPKISAAQVGALFFLFLETVVFLEVYLLYSLMDIWFNLDSLRPSCHLQLCTLLVISLLTWASGKSLFPLLTPLKPWSLSSPLSCLLCFSARWALPLLSFLYFKFSKLNFFFL